MPKESFLISMAKLIVTVVLIVCIGAVLGLMGYYLLEQKNNIDIARNLNTNEQKNEDREFTKEIIQKYNYKNLPQFQEFPTSNTRMDFIAPIDFSKNEKAVEFKTVLNEGIKSGSNFASQYAVVSWGCGTECQVIAIVNAKNGNVYFSPFSAFSYGVDFKLNSSLIIINPISKIKEVHEDEIPSWLKTYYYNWNGNELELIYELNYKKDSLADWKTYRNEEYGFEVKYPEEYIIKDRKEFYHKNSEISFGFYVNQGNTAIPNMDIVVYRKADKKMFLKNYLKDSLGVENLQFSEAINSNNINAVKITNQKNEFGLATNMLCRSYCFLSEDYFFDFFFYQDWTNSEKSKSYYDIDAEHHVQFADDVFSTFKFIEK